MKKTYLAPHLAQYGSVEQLTAIFGGPAQRDVLRDSNTVVLVGQQSINACSEVSGNCLP